jgi:4-amino-4-deoxy-L-arabinose transferase-like glycosyltransferase
VSGQAHGRFWFWFRLFVLAGVLRGGWLAANTASLQSDPDTYRQLARNLLAEGTFGYRVGDATGAADRVQTTAYRPPLYPLTLAAVGWTDGVGSTSVAILHWAFGVATVLLVYRLSQEWGLGRWGLLATLLVACDPILLNQSSLVMTETLATLLAVLALWCVTRAAAAHSAASSGLRSSGPSSGGARIASLIVAGASVGLAALVRPTFLVWAAAIGIVGLLPTGEAYRRRLMRAGLFALSAGAVLAPWALRNALVLDRFLLTTTHGGYTLWLGNNPEFYRSLRQGSWGDVWDSQQLDQQYLRICQAYAHDELRADRWAYEQARAAIAIEPASFLRACVFRIRSLWGLVPHQTDPAESAARRWARYAVGLWYAAVLGLAGVGVGTLGRRLLQPPWLWGLLLCLAFTALHSVYWSNLRMRAPLMPAVCLAAAAGARRLALTRFVRGPIARE